MKTLVLFTSSFPFGSSEAFIESEFPFLCKAFEKIIIVTNELEVENKREVPENVTIIRYPYYPSFSYKVRAVFSVNTKIFKREVKFIREKLRLSIQRSVLFTLLASIAKGYETRDFIIEEILKKHSLNVADTWFYSYWMNDIAIGLAMLKKKLPEAKTLCRAHRGDLYFYTTPIHYLPLRTFLLKHLNKCYVVSEDGCRYLSELLGKETASNVVVSRLGTFLYTKQLKSAPKNVPIIVSCSTLTLPKRVPLIVSVLSRLSHLKVKWFHFGEGVLRSEIEKETSHLLSKKENIKYSLPGHYSNKDLMKFYSENQIDLFINVSSSEGIPVSIMEAMSFGIPVIATAAAGATAEIVKDGYNGYLLNVNTTPTEIANVITNHFSLTDAQKNELSQNAFKTWDENYNAEKNYREFIGSVLAL